MSCLRQARLDLSKQVSLRYASKLCGYSARRLIQFIHSGELPAQRKGQRAWTITLMDLHVCIQQRIFDGKSRKSQLLEKLDLDNSSVGTMRREFFRELCEPQKNFSLLGTSPT